MTGRYAVPSQTCDSTTRLIVKWIQSEEDAHGEGWAGWVRVGLSGVLHQISVQTESGVPCTTGRSFSSLHFNSTNDDWSTHRKRLQQRHYGRLFLGAHLSPAVGVGPHDRNKGGTRRKGQAICGSMGSMPKGQYQCQHQSKRGMAQSPSYFCHGEVKRRHLTGIDQNTGLALSKSGVLPQDNSVFRFLPGNLPPSEPRMAEE